MAVYVDYPNSATALQINDYYGLVGSQAAMLALFDAALGGIPQRGDYCIRTDLTPSRIFIVTGADATQIGSWLESPVAEVTSIEIEQTFSTATDKVPSSNFFKTGYDYIIGLISSLSSVVSGKEPAIANGTTSQYIRGDKSLATMDKNAVGLGSVDNTADSAKNVLSASKLTTARNINGVPFDGSGDITVVDGTKQDTITGAATSIVSFNLTASRVVVTDTNGKITISSITTALLDYLSGLTGNIQSQFSNKQDKDTTLTALAGFNSNGIMVQTSPDNFTSRQIDSVNGKIVVTNPTGVTSNPTLQIDETVFDMYTTKENVSNKSTTTTLGNSDTLYPTQNAVKTYVDNLITGLKWKQSVLVATTTNGTLATAYANGQTIDGVTLATGNRILIKNQTTGSENGIYTVNASGAPTRATDADSNTEMLSATVFVEQGTANADSVWACSTNSISLGSTSLTFVQLAGAGLLATKQDTLVSGTNIKTVGGASILGSGDLSVGAINFTYGETITAGNLVELRSDGKVYKIAGITSSLKQTAPFDSINSGSYIDSTNNKIIAWGKDSTGNYSLRCGSLSGATVTWGTKVSFYGSGSATLPIRARVEYMPGQSCYILATTTSSGTQIELQGFTVSGNTITKVGFETNINEGATITNLQMCVISSSLIALFYSSSGGNKIRTVSVSSGTLTLNSVATSGNLAAFMVWNSAESRLYVSGGGAYIYNYTLSGTTLSLSQGNLSSYLSYTNMTLGGLIYNSATGKTMAVLANSTGLGIFCELYVATIASTNDFIGIKPIFNTSSFLTHQSDALENSRQFSFNASSVGVQMITGGIDSRYNAYLELATNKYTRRIGLDIYSDGTMIFQQNGGIACVFVNYNSTRYIHVLTNCYIANYIGVANASGILNDSKEVLLSGKTYTTTGLTAGANYYVQLDGTFSTTPTGLFLGKAISTTQLLLDI